MTGDGPGVGHNGGPTMEPGAAWRRHCWGRARAALLPHLPVEVLRGRLRRAAELGLDYRTYAGIRATTGHDVVAVLFSSNALAEAARMPRVAAVAQAARIGLALAPVTVATLLDRVPALDAAHPAPALLAPWAEARARLRAALGRIPSDQAILVAEFPLERDWAVAARLGGSVPADRYFAAG